MTIQAHNNFDAPTDFKDEVTIAQKLVLQSRKLIEASRQAREMSELCRTRRQLVDTRMVQRTMIDF